MEERKDFEYVYFDENEGKDFEKAVDFIKKLILFIVVLFVIYKVF